ncbi:MAG: hypothetical protein P8X88_01125 [Gammaproteobacteria bacterium]
MLPVHLKYCCVIILLSLTIFSFAAQSFDIDTSITIDTIEGNGLEFHDIELNFNSLLAKNTTYFIKIGSAILPEEKGYIKNIIFQCSSGVISKQEFACEDGELTFKNPLFSANKSKIQFYRNKNGDLKITVGNFGLAGGIAALHASSNDGVWQVNLKSNNISFVKLRKLLPTFPDLISSGLVQSNINFSGTGSLLQTIYGNVLAKKVAFSNSDSTLVGEDVAVKLSFSSIRNKNIWQSEINSTTFHGELYFDPIFINANSGPKDLYGNITWQVGSSKIELNSLHYEDTNALHIEMATTLDYKLKKAIAPVQVNIKYALFPKTYDEYLLPFLLDTNIADLTTTGMLGGSILIDENRIVEADLKLDYLSFEDNQNKFSILNLNGSVGWGERYAGKEYQLSFEAASIYKLRLDASQFSFLNNKKVLELRQAVSVPILDGAINIESFKVSSPGQEEQSILMDISLMPVSMSKVSNAFGWPEMNGNLAGYAPNVTYKNGDVDIKGALLIRGFGGSTTIHKLSATDLFSITPKVSADIQIKNLDLKTLTETFSFGEITGRLDGTINNLQFVSWSPVQFEAWLGTPENDNSKHRISQTAVDNLTQVGNGTSNILSKSFLKFFDSFGYDKLGLGCKLKNNICSMTGVSSKAGENSQGFYIVKGSGVPRIDVVGFTDQVSWSVLIARLKRVVSTKEVIVN